MISRLNDINMIQTLSIICKNKRSNVSLIAWHCQSLKGLRLNSIELMNAWSGLNYSQNVKQT